VSGTAGIGGTSDAAFVRSVFHPTDFSPASASAFGHALAVALHRKAKLTLLHVARNKPSLPGWDDFPAVRETLIRWGLIERGSSRSDVSERLGLEVKKVRVEGDDVAEAILSYLEDHPSDLSVLTTEGRSGLPAWLRESVAERLARQTRTRTLFVPERGFGIVSEMDGRILLRKILLPIDRDPDPHHALNYAAHAALLANGAPVEMQLLHVGDRERVPEIVLPEVPACSWSELHTEGDVVEQIVNTAEEQKADLIVMTTRGHDGILDALRGSVTERVLRRARCPVLAVPAHN
jgi:nucleotide-binding universal stress UspA family protein